MSLLSYCTLSILNQQSWLRKSFSSLPGNCIKLNKVLTHEYINFNLKNMTGEFIFGKAQKVLYIYIKSSIILTWTVYNYPVTKLKWSLLANKTSYCDHNRFASILKELAFKVSVTNRLKEIR